MNRPELSLGTVKEVCLVMETTTFTVQISIPTSHHVRIVGNISQLGEWSPTQTTRMKPLLSSNHPEVTSWTAEVVVSDVTEYEYRYMVCDDLSGEHFVIVKIGPLMKRKASAVIDDGRFDAADWGDGWLLHETEVHLTIHNADCHPIALLPGSKSQDNFQIKMSKLENNNGTLFECDPSTVIAKVVGECYSAVEKQNETGIGYNPSLHYSFVSHVPSINDAYFKIVLYSSESSYIGCGHILPINMSGSCGILNVVITNDQQCPVGSIQIEYLLIKPLSDQSLHNLANWSDRVWQGKGGTLLMGHRGCGSTFSSAQYGVQENTIESFMLSKERGDDGLELDVHLTKDYQPVIYHDLDINAGLITKDGGKLKRSFQVHQLTYKELRKIKLELTASDELNNEINSRVERDRMIAPTLEEVLRALPEEFPMELEVKYIETEKDKKDDPYLDVNEYIDVVLKTVLQNIGKRKIILMSFSPIIVQLMHRKQRQIPVKIAVCGDTPKYPVYRDIRIRSVGRIIGFAACQGILGISSFNECILDDPNLIKELKSRGLILSTWGKSNNFEDIREKQKQRNVDVICYDRCAKLTPS